MDFTHLTVSENPPQGGKTKSWLVRNKHDGDVLGSIAWFGRWRKYAFYPIAGCVFEEVCMRELSTFIADRTKEHKRDGESAGSQPKGK